MSSIPVSYTHLDVYKRQQINMLVSLICGYCNLSERMLIFAGILNQIVTLKYISNALMKRIKSNYRKIVGFNSGLIAVSYTHLDVYKRQV